MSVLREALKRRHDALKHPSLRFPVFSRQVVEICAYLLIFSVLSSRVGAQSLPDKKTAVGYAPPPAHAKIMHIIRLEGQVVIALASEKRVRAASGYQVALFDREHLSVVTVVSGEEGQFHITDVAPGSYTLVVAEDALHLLSLPLQVVASRSNNASADFALLLTMRLKSDGRRSVAAPITNRSLRAELLERLDEDQKIRNEAIKHGIEHPDKQIQMRSVEIDARNLVRMREIVRRYGWPTRALVGVDGTEAAFLLLQHSPYQFQKELLPRIRRAYRSGELTGQDYALLSDRVLMREGKPQVYGTQVVGWHDREPAFYLIQDKAHVDRRRASVGLLPLADYVKILKEAYFPEKKK